MYSGASFGEFLNGRWGLSDHRLSTNGEFCLYDTPPLRTVATFFLVYVQGSFLWKQVNKLNSKWLCFCACACLAFAAVQCVNAKRSDNASSSESESEQQEPQKSKQTLTKWLARVKSHMFEHSSQESAQQSVEQPEQLSESHASKRRGLRMMRMGKWARSIHLDWLFAYISRFEMQPNVLFFVVPLGVSATVVANSHTKLILEREPLDFLLS